MCDVLARSYRYLRFGGYKQSIEYGKKALSIARYVRKRERDLDAPVVLSGSHYEVGDYHELTKRRMWQTSPEYCKGSKKQKKKSGRMRCSSLTKHSTEYGKNSPFPSSRLLEIWCRN